MNNKPHTEQTKKKISEAQKRRWANMTEEERNRRSDKLSNFYQILYSREREQEDRVWLQKHKEYIWDEFNRLFG